MTTSLAQQLKKLQLPQSSVYKEQKKKDSLLFDPKEAASIDRETFYEIGLSGFTELKNINPFFNVFETTLFSVSSKDFERAIQTEDANKRLNATIRSFLLKLSPYFLLQPAHKALEWLIQRFHIHLYNKDDIFTLILPYHETKIFVRFVQIMKLDDPTDFWNWLEPIQKPGIPLAKVVLHNHCITNVAFLKFISEMIKGTLDEFGDKAEILTTLFAFYCSTIVGTLENSPKITEPIVTNILPGIMECLSSPLIDLRAAGYMITAQLVLKVQLKAKTAKHLVHKIILFNPELNYEAVLLLHIIYESQSNIINISEKCLNNFTPNHLEMLCLNLGLLIKSGINITKFLLAFMRGVLPLVQRDLEYFKRFSKLPEAVIAEVNVESSTAEELIKCIIDCYNPKNIYSEKQSNEDSDIEMIEEEDFNIQSWYSKFLKSLEQKYPAEFDQVLKQYRTNSQVSKEKLSSLCQILGFAQKIMKKLGDSYLFEKLYHHNIDVRVQAVDYLISEFKNLCVDNKKFLSESILDRLNDESPDVVLPILSLNINSLIDVIDTEIFLNNLQKIINRGQLNSIWWNAACKAIDILLSFDIKLLNNEICFSIMPYLFPTNEVAKNVTLNILRSKLGEYLLLNQNISSISNDDDHKKICKDVFNFFKIGSNLKQKDLVDILDWAEEENYISIVFSMILISFNIKNENSENNVKLLHEITQFIKRLNIVTVDDSTILSEESIITFIDVSKNNKFPIEVYMYFLQQQIYNTDVLNRTKPWIDFCGSNSSNEFIINLIEILLNSRFRKFKKYYSITMKVLLDIICPNNKERVEFMANLVIGFTSARQDSENYGESNAILIRAIRIMGFMLSNINDLSWVSQSDIMLTSLLLCIYSKEVVVRNIAFDMIETLLEKCKDIKVYLTLLKELSDRREELIMDNNQLPIVLYSLMFHQKDINLDEATIISMNLTRNSILSIIINKLTPYHVKRCLTTILTYVKASHVLIKLSPIALDVLQDSKDSKLDYHRSQTYANIINRINSTTFVDNNDKLWNLIVTSLNTEITLIDSHKNILYSCVFMMKQIDQEFLNVLPLNKAQEIIKLVIYAGTFGKNPFLMSTATKVIKRIELNSNQIMPLFNDMEKVYISDKSKSNKRISAPQLAVLESNEWKLGMTLLENIQDKKKINGMCDILKALFNILKMCLNFEEQSAVEYIKQVLLSCILHCCQKVYPFDNNKEKEVYKKIIDLELIVLCIRGTQNPQTHHHTLMLLPQIATMYPDDILQHMMAIFTFIGSSVLRQDDAYSFQIITKIIETVIPILVNIDCEMEMTDELVAELEPRVIPVLRIFVDAVLDIPEHRRFILFKKLINTLSPQHFLWSFLGLMFESYVMHGASEKKTVDEQQRKLSDKEKPVGRLDFAISLAVDFPPDIIIDTCNRLITYLKMLPEDKVEEESTNKIDPTVIFSVPHHTAKQLRHYKYTIVTFVNSLLSSEIFIANVNCYENKTKMEQFYKVFIVNILTFIQTVSKTADQNVGKPQAKYWKVMLHHCYEVLDNVNNLLLCEMFVIVVRGLMSHNLLAVKKKAMEILNNKLQHNPSFFTMCDKSVTFSLLDPLLKMIEDIKTNVAKPPINRQEIEVNEQTALLSLKLLIRLLCGDNPEEFKPILSLITDLIKLPSLNGNLLASVVLCLAELCSSLRTHAISSLPIFMPSLIKILKTQTKADAPELVLLSVITAIYKVVDTIPRFLSPYLEKLLYQLAILSAKWEKNNKSSPIMAKLIIINNKISNKIAPRVLIPVISQCYNLLLKKGSFDAIGPAMNILAESFSGVTGPNFTALQQDLTNFFLLALQFRSDYVQENIITPQQIFIIEEHIIKAVVALVLKLSESSFRPLYYKMYDWSIRHNEDKHKYRSITFYRLSAHIAESLRGLFILFAGHFVKNASDLLNACNKTKCDNLHFNDESECCELIEYILKAFNSIFTHDSQNFVNKERFETIMQPLVDQLDNTVGGTESLTIRGKELIIPCIAQFSMATADDSLWKPLNYQILLKTRHSDPSIRLLGLECMREMASKLGDSWLPLLPESVPFLAELLEDDVPAVESATQKAIQTLESVLGEPLQKYF